MTYIWFLLPTTTVWGTISLLLYPHHTTLTSPFDFFSTMRTCSSLSPTTISSSFTFSFPASTSACSLDNSSSKDWNEKMKLAELHTHLHTCTTSVPLFLPCVLQLVSVAPLHISLSPLSEWPVNTLKHSTLLWNIVTEHTQFTPSPISPSNTHHLPFLLPSSPSPPSMHLSPTSLKHPSSPSSHNTPSPLYTSLQHTPPPFLSSHLHLRHSGIMCLLLLLQTLQSLVQLR